MNNTFPNKGRSLKKKILWVVLPILLFLFLINASFLADPNHDSMLFAHRALGQDFSREGLTGSTCTAARTLPTEHEHIENTLPAMEAAFDFGAHFVELDVHLTQDDSFAVFHDWTLDCRTDGQGSTRDQTMPYLRSLDVGYGYTLDEGSTWPFRGKGTGMMPSLHEVLSHFTDRNFVIDIKSNEEGEGQKLAARISSLSEIYNGELILTGGPRPVAEVQTELPHLKAVTRPQLRKCLMGYVGLGWIGHVPAACSNSLLTVPVNVAPWLWGWPNRFISRMEKAGSYVTLIGPYHGEGFSNGYNDPALLEKLPKNYKGGLWTDRIDLIAPRLED